MTATAFPDIENELLAAIRAREESPVIIVDLGCGLAPAEGFVGYDKYAKGERIEYADLYEAPWPFAAESVDYAACSHFLEHVPSWDLHFVEMYRCLKPGAFYRIIGPHANSNRAKQDPDHKQWLLAERFAYLDQGWRRAQGVEHYEAPVNFSVYFLGYVWHQDFTHREEVVRMWALAHYLNAVDDIIVILKKEPLLGVGGV